MEQAAQHRDTDYISAYSLGEAYSLIGDTGRAIRWLRESYAGRETYLLDIRWNPAFDPLRKDPSFQEIVKGVPL